MLIQKNVEIWSPIEGYPDYEVSDHGQVRSFVRSFKYGAPQYLKPKQLPGGHLFVALCRSDEKPKNRYVHRLVLENFVGPAGPRQVCRHLDGDPTNNRESNLVWGTQAENIQDTVRHGTSNRSLTPEQVKYARENPKQLSQNAIADELGVSYRTIGKLINNKTYQEGLTCTNNYL